MVNGALVQAVAGADKHLAALQRVAGALARNAGQRRVLEEVLAILERELGLFRGTILLLSADGDGLDVEVVGDVAADDPHDLRYHKGEGVTGRVWETGEPIVIERIADVPEFRDRIHRRQRNGIDGFGFVCVPIVVAGAVLGTCAFDVPGGDVEVLNATVQTLTIVASMLAGDVVLRRRAMTRRHDGTLAARAVPEDRLRPPNIVGNSSAMQQVYRRIHQVAFADTTVLVRGETGTGKELVASAVHSLSPRRDGPLVQVNCAALNENLLESELFGHEKGAFTGALDVRIGRLEEADGGTLFLDEIGDISPNLQVRLLRVLQERAFQRVGSNKTVHVDVRVIAATNRDLEAAVASRAFREDLYYRVNIFPIVLPPLRERRDDILLLADHFVEKYARLMQKPVRRISTAAINMMFAYHWPGNVRELENCIQHAVLVADAGVIHGHTLPPTLQMPDVAESRDAGGLVARVAVLEKDMIIDALKRTDGNIAAAARDLGITSRMVRYKIQKLNIEYARLFKDAD